MKTYKTKKGYYYKVYKNKKKKRIRISETEYLRINKTESLKMNGGSDKWIKYISVEEDERYVRYDFEYLSEEGNTPTTYNFQVIQGQSPNNRNTTHNKKGQSYEILQVETTEPPDIIISETISNIPDGKWKDLLQELDEFVKKKDNNIKSQLIEKEHIEKELISNLLTYSGKIMFTSFYEYIKEYIEKYENIITKGNIKRLENNQTSIIRIFDKFIERYVENYIHTLIDESGKLIQFKLGNRLGGGSSGVIYPIKDSNICIKFILLNKRDVKRDGEQNNENMNTFLNKSDIEKTILPLKRLHMNNDLSTYTNSKNKSRIRVYLMLKCDSDLVSASKKYLRTPDYIVWSPMHLKYILNRLMEQFHKLQAFYPTDNGIPIGTSYPKINPVQLFELRPANCALSISNGVIHPYLIDLDGYYIQRTNTNKSGVWISSYPPIEFYKDRELGYANYIKPNDFAKLIDSHSNYYKHGLHLSWMLGILIYQMINYYSNSHASETDKSNFFDFNHYKKHLLRNCTVECNLFTSLDNFVHSLDEPFKSEWTTVGESRKSFLDEIKSCLYFDDGVYDSYSLRQKDIRDRPDHHIHHSTYTNINKNNTRIRMKKINPELEWSEPLTNNNGQFKLGQRRRFYNDDGTPNLFL
jgi:hypothetical protein